ncbi:MAG TPA: hypothetical protein VMZ52_08590 [Bryobacteraceae bacterium]|nr:hypothetical protein [Bryobacteraceae bacterium]
MRILTLLLISVSLGFSLENPAGIPKGAVAISPLEYRYKDAKGKTWIYRKSPFGYSKTEESAAAPAAPGHSMPTPFGASVKAADETTEKQKAGNPFGSRKRADTATAADSEASVTAKEEGDSIRFEKQTPFGSYKWTRKKTALTAEEQQLWERQRANNTAKTGSK